MSAKAGIGILSLSSQVTYTDYIGDGQDGVLTVNLSAKATFGVISTDGSVTYKKDFTTSNDSFEIKAGIGLNKNNNQKTNKTELSLNGTMKWKWSDGEWSRKGDLTISYSEAYSSTTPKQSSSGLKENTDSKWIELIKREEYYRKADFSIIDFLQYLYKRNNNSVGYEKTHNNNFGIVL